LSVTIDLRSRTPIYKQIIDDIKERVLYGTLKPDEQIPSIRQLTRELGINPNTIHKAYAELQHQGVIYTLAGRGVFISSVLEKEKLTEAKRDELLKEIENMVACAKKLKIEKKYITELINKIFDDFNNYSQKEVTIWQEY
jgi:GntR family transcriptional regulator